VRLALGAAPLVFMPAVVALAIALGNYPLLVMLVHLSIFGGLGLTWAFRSMDGLRDLPGAVTADDRGLLVDGRVVTPRSQIKQGFVVSHGPAALVKLERRGPRPAMLVRVATTTEGRALLRNLGLDATQSVADIRAASWVLTQSLGKQLALTVGPMLGGFLPLLFGLLALFPTLGAIPAAVLVPLMLAYIFGIALAPTRVRIGTDGVFTKWLMTERFVSFAEIESVVAYEDVIAGKHYVGAILQLVGGETTKLCSGQKNFFSDGGAAILVERLREALDAHRSGARGVDTSALARGSRSGSEWFRALRRIGAGADVDARHAGMSLEALVSAVHDTTLDPAARVGAAVAALPYATPAERRRIRIAAETTAEPRLRIALEKVTAADAEDADVTLALEELAAIQDSR